MAQCGKMRLLDRLLQQLHAHGHKVLIFSQVGGRGGGGQAGEGAMATVGMAWQGGRGNPQSMQLMQ